MAVYSRITLVVQTQPSGERFLQWLSLQYQKYIIFYEYIRYLVIARHYSSLLVIFVIFCLSGGAEKARKIPENEQ